MVVVLADSIQQEKLLINLLDKATFVDAFTIMIWFLAIRVHQAVDCIGVLKKMFNMILRDLQNAVICKIMQKLCRSTHECLIKKKQQFLLHL